ncbi:MAG: glucuronyl hydrolase [Bacteroidetes bacterium]|nr:MAG: glucuronyl hydrolase [Bacteroidota bacterium]
MNNRKIAIIGFLVFFFGAMGCTEKPEEPIFSVEKAKKALDFSVIQYKYKMNAAPPGKIPVTFKDDTVRYSDIYWWVSGFYPGSLWYLYEYTGNEVFRKEAHERTMLLEPLKNHRSTHDLGFMLYCSFGNGLRLTGNEEYRQIMLTGAESLASRYNPVAKSIKSWDFGDEWQHPVIIDNMMNLEYLMWAAKASGTKKFEEIAVNHAYTSLEHFYRDDYSTHHVVDFDSITGDVINKFTHQGYSDESTWARGQSWGLYGFTMMYRESGEKDFLELAVKSADFLLDHPNLPDNKIPFWDYDSPDIPDTYRDASAAAIMASALLELSAFVRNDKSDKYFSAAEIILANLSSDNYMAEEGENGGFILKHSVGFLPANSEVDVPLSYADYYFIEALHRYINSKRM